MILNNILRKMAGEFFKPQSIFTHCHCPRVTLQIPFCEEILFCNKYWLQRVVYMERGEPFAIVGFRSVSRKNWAAGINNLFNSRKLIDVPVWSLFFNSSTFLYVEVTGEAKGEHDSSITTCLRSSVSCFSIFIWSLYEYEHR